MMFARDLYFTELLYSGICARDNQGFNSNLKINWICILLIRALKRFHKNTLCMCACTHACMYKHRKSNPNLICFVLDSSEIITFLCHLKGSKVCSSFTPFEWSLFFEEINNSSFRNFMLWKVYYSSYLL